MTSAIPVQRSTNWANKPTGSWSFDSWSDNIDVYASSNHLNARRVLALLYKTDKLKWILLPSSLYKINSSRIKENKSDEKSAWLPLVTAKNEKNCKPPLLRV